VACQQLDAVTHPDESVAAELHELTVPVKVNVLADRALCKKMGAVWTPIFAFVDGDGVEHHRFIGFLPPDEFKAQIHLARAREAFAKGDYARSRAVYQGIVDRFANTDAAPESLYWTGVCDFKLTKDMQSLLDRCKEVPKRYPAHIWARKLDFIK
jgi:TolA-binding protein